MSDDVDRLIAERKPAMAFTLGGMGSAKTNFYNDAYCRAGYEDDAKAVQSLWIDGKRDQAVARVPDEMVLLTNLIGPPGLLLHFLTCLVTGKGLPRSILAEGKDQPYFEKRLQRNRESKVRN